ncbi:BadF/BadG/BcrA/BcrD ATPase family protein [Microbacterium abyssi]|uniref:BadF/BadG/BcrA/BcrD ATPase family protein n=1 Tax=Microbacterium abyssi TaxID=2782166 RepID=UPI0018898C4C|nr:BadF/BadG/BcrA/BcrD ATPase family protein [Microbacterium sp. A18JL241]
MSPTQGAVGIDVGASGIRIATLLDGVRADIVTEEPLPRLNGHVDVEALARLLGAKVRAQLSESSPTIDAVTIGMAGFPDLVDSPRRLADMLLSQLGARRVVLAADAYTSHVGALGLRSGTVVAAGTGVIALGTDHDTAWVRADGWGLLLGDQGGGAWIGQRGLRAAMHAADGRRGGSMMLLDSLIDRFDGTDRLVRQLYASSAPAILFGQFAPAVADAARAGDAIAQAIWREAGRHLALTAAAAARDVGPVFSWAGGVFAAGDLVLESFRSELLAARPDAIVVEPLASSAHGALRLALEVDLRSNPPFLEVFAQG